MRCIIAGSRTFDDYEIVKRQCDLFIAKEATILSGTARGADELGERYANDHHLERYPADWKKHGKAAGPIRNRQMARLATHCILFVDCDEAGALSAGSQSMLTQATDHGLEIVVVRRSLDAVGETVAIKDN